MAAFTAEDITFDADARVAESHSSREFYATIDGHRFDLGCISVGAGTKSGKFWANRFDGGRSFDTAEQAIGHLVKGANKKGLSEHIEKQIADYGRLRSNTMPVGRTGTAAHLLAEIAA